MLPAEKPLLALAARYEDAERRVRALLAQAVEGDRRALLTQALEILLALRRDAQTAPDLLDGVYATTVALSAARMPGQLGRVLAGQLDAAAALAADGSRAAFRTVTAETIEDAAHEAVTARRTADGRRLTLGSHATAVTASAARRASTRGTLDAAGPTGLVRYSSHGSVNPICAPLEGETFPAASAPQPPLHPGCDHSLIAV